MHSGGDCQRRALAQFTWCGVRHRPGHHRGRWIYRTIAGNHTPVSGIVLCSALLRALVPSQNEHVDFADALRV